jgi:hypothetical protein
MRNVLAYKNNTKLAVEGACAPNTEILCLRTNSYSYYIPCMAFIVAVTASGRFTVDLWKDRSERVTVTPKAVLWPSDSNGKPITDGFYACSFCVCRYPNLAKLMEHNKMSHDGGRAA